MQTIQIPDGFERIETGYLQLGDIIFDEKNSWWKSVTSSQAAVGYPVKDYCYVCRKEKLNNLFVEKLFHEGFTLKQVECIVDTLDSVCSVCHNVDITERKCYCASVYDE